MIVLRLFFLLLLCAIIFNIFLQFLCFLSQFLFLLFLILLVLLYFFLFALICLPGGFLIFSLLWPSTLCLITLQFYIFIVNSFLMLFLFFVWRIYNRLTFLASVFWHRSIFCSVLIFYCVCFELSFWVNVLGILWLILVFFLSMNISLIMHLRYLFFDNLLSFILQLFYLLVLGFTINTLSLVAISFIFLFITIINKRFFLLCLIWLYFLNHTFFILLWLFSFRWCFNAIIHTGLIILIHS